MTNEETIFPAALNKPLAAERAEFLDQVCAGDTALRRSIDMLLRAHERGGGILEASPVNLDGPTQAFTPAECLGPGRRRELLGRDHATPVGAPADALRDSTGVRQDGVAIVRARASP